MIAICGAVSLVLLGAALAAWDIARRRIILARQDVLSRDQLTSKLQGMADAIDELQAWRKSEQAKSGAARVLSGRRIVGG